MGATLQEQFRPESPFESCRPRRAGNSRAKFLRWFSVLVVVWFVSGMYEGAHLKRGFVPWDAGAYAESATRLLHGQLPHRDFVELYTGGLTDLNAGAMRMFGENFAAERIVLFAFFLAWIPALYWIAAQFCGDFAAGALVLLAVAWSVPNYSEAVPSWYNLFFATFGVAALLAYLKRPAWKWLLAAGVCGGLSFLAKSVGLCYVAGALLFFLFREQSMRVPSSAMGESFGQSAGRKSRISAYTVFLFVSLAIFLSLLIRLVSPLAAAGPSAFADEFILFVLPSVALSCVLIVNELRIRNTRATRLRFAELLRLCIPFGIGVILPILAFLAPYLRAHATAALLHDLFTQASTRIATAYEIPDGVVTIIPAISLVVVAAASARLRHSARWMLMAGVAALLACGIIFSFGDDDAYIAVWSAAYWLLPALVAAGAGILLASSFRFAPDDPAQENSRRQQLFLLLSVVALCGLVQFPFSAPIYFCYVAPLVLLMIAAILRAFPRVSRALLAALYTGFLVFVLFVVTPGFIYVMGFRHAPDVQTASIDLPAAGGLRVDPASAAIYNKLIPLIRAHAGSGQIYAAPDCPEVYFLSGYRNLTPDIYDFLDPQSRDPQRILRLFADPQIRVVILNDKPPLSPPLSAEIHRAIAERFPANDTVGNFEVRWRNSD